MAGANIMTKAQIPRTAPSFCGGKICIATANINGKIKPVPIPWIIRPARTTGNPVAHAEITDPEIKAHKPKTTIWRLVNHLEIKLESGKIIPIINI